MAVILLTFAVVRFVPGRPTARGQSIELEQDPSKYAAVTTDFGATTSPAVGLWRMTSVVSHGTFGLWPSSCGSMPSP